MARQTFKNLQAAVRRPFKTRFGLGAQIISDGDMDNNYAMTFSNAADTASVEAIRVDTDNLVRIGGQAIKPLSQQVTFRLFPNAEQAKQCFFIADRACTIMGITEIHAAACTTAGTVTATIFKDSGTVAPGAGATTMTNTFNLKVVANTLQTATLLAVNNDGSPNVGIVLAAGDRLSFVPSTATLTTLAGIQITVTLTPGCKSVLAPYYCKSNTRLLTANFFVANQPMVVTGVYAVWSTAFAAAVTVDITKDTSTNAPGAGTSILLAAMDGTSAINTVLTPALAASSATLALAAGDRLSVKYYATTPGAGVVIYVVMAPLYSTINVNYNVPADGADIVSESLFTADRDYEVVDISSTWKTASGTSGVIDYTIDRGTTAPGAGTVCTTATTDATATAETPLVSTPAASRRNRVLSAGDRLGIKVSGTLNGLANVTANATLKPV